MDRIRRSFAKTMSVISRNLLLSIDLFLYLTVIVFTIYYILNVLIILLHWRWLERFSPENVLFTSTNIPADSVTILKIAICDLKRKKSYKIMTFRKRNKKCVYWVCTQPKILVLQPWHVYGNINRWFNIQNFVCTCLYKHGLLRMTYTEKIYIPRDCAKLSMLWKTVLDIYF